jgi:hypothetical protein
MRKKHQNLIQFKQIENPKTQNMNTRIKLLVIFASLFLTLSFSVPVNAQEPPHPPSSGHGMHSNQPAGGSSAPLDGGLRILLAMGFYAGGRKYYHFKNEV